MILLLAAAVAALPQPVQAFIERRETCLHLAGEEAFDEDRARFLTRQLETLQCDKLDAEQRRLQRSYGKRQDVRNALSPNPDELAQ